VGSSVIHSNMLREGSSLSGIDVGTSNNASIIGNTIDDVGSAATGIQLAASDIFGIYVNDVIKVNITNNSVRDVGSNAENNTAFIKVGDDVGSSVIHSNMLREGSSLSGIDVGTSNNASIIGNTIDDVGSAATGNASTSTVFIRGNSTGAKVSDNVLVASDTETSPFGIYWAGAGSQTQISNNILKAATPGGASFRDYGIRVLGTDMDYRGPNVITYFYERGVVFRIRSNISD
ncbi:unnamed protein product, partial [marine sediment metagenome]